MNTEFQYKGPRREVGFRYAGRDWVFLAILIAGGSLVVSAIATMAGPDFNGEAVLQALRDFLKSWLASKGP